MRSLSPSQQALMDKLHFAGIRVEIVQKDEWFVPHSVIPLPHRLV
jgi:hypothetical protein